jgi:uncharacterized protein with PQ loop repeat
MNGILHSDMKETIGAIAVLLTFVGYIPYVRDTIRGKTKPHIYTWFIWSFISFIAFALQMSDGAGPGAYVTLAAAIVCGFIVVLGMRQGGADKRITKLDTFFLVAALLATGIWVFVKQPVISVILLSLIDILGFLPTVLKSWKKPHEETLFSYALNTFRFALSLYALHKYTIVSALYPLTWVIANGLFSVFLILRRRRLSHSLGNTLCN